MRKSILLLILLCAIVWVARVAAAMPLTISLEPSRQQIFQGDLAILDLNIGGLIPDPGNPADRILIGAFDVDIGYEPTLLTAAPVVMFDGFLGDPELSETVTGADTSNPGLLSIDAVSLLFDFELDAFQRPQGDSFRLARMAFRGDDIGESLISVVKADISDEFGNDLKPVQAENARVNVVPEPATLLLLGSGLVGLVTVGRKKLGKR